MARNFWPFWIVLFCFFCYTIYHFLCWFIIYFVISNTQYLKILPLLQWNFDGCRLLQLIYRSFGQFYIFWYYFLWNSKKNKKSETKQISNNGTFFCPSACLNSSISLLHTHESWHLTSNWFISDHQSECQLLATFRPQPSCDK